MTPAALSGMPLGAATPLRFAMVADVQYADQETAGKREYRKSLDKLRAAVEAMEREHPDFAIELGDLVDGGAENYQRIAAVFDRLRCPKYRVLGNHDFFAERRAVERAFGLERGYYEFRARGWHFAVLDGMQVSVKGGWPKDSAFYREGERLLAELKARGEPNAQDWNGAAGREQRAWLARVLDGAAARGERSMVFCHFPALAESCRPEHLLWDHEQVRDVLERHGRVAAYWNGHDHNGGWGERNGIHYVTLAGMVEHDAVQSLRVIEVEGDKLRVRGAGEVRGRELALRK